MRRKDESRADEGEITKAIHLLGDVLIENNIPLLEGIIALKTLAAQSEEQWGHRLELRHGLLS